MTPMLQMRDFGVALPRGGGWCRCWTTWIWTWRPGNGGAGGRVGIRQDHRLAGSHPAAAAAGADHGADPVGRMDLTALNEPALRQVRGRHVGMVFQNPLAALNPTRTVGSQIIEGYRIHTATSATTARNHAKDLLGEVGIRDPAARLDDFPHQFSGGMRQRVMIAIALACRRNC